MTQDWVDIFKDKLKDDEVHLPDGDRAVMNGMLKRHIRERKLRMMSLLAAPVAATIALALILVNAEVDGEVEPVRIVEEIIDNQREITTESTLEELISQVAPKRLALNKVNDKKEEKEETEVPRIIAEEQEDIIVEEPAKDNIGINEIEDIYKEKDETKPSDWSYPETGHKRQPHPLSVRFSSSFFSSENYPEEEDINRLGPDVIKPAPIKPEFTNRPGSGEHRHPVTIGIAASLMLKDRLFLTSGLDYSYCFSRITLNSGDRVEQQAHYLGIPLHLDFVPISNDRFSLYVGAGAEARTCVFARHNRKSLVKDGNIYYSAICLAGLRYEPTRNIGIFVEPQYSYNFLREDPRVLSPYTDARNLFTFKAGLSFSFR